MSKAHTVFKVGDRVVRLMAAGANRNYWSSGVVVMVVPAGVSPYAMWLRWFKDKGECKFLMAREPMIHKERFIVQVENGGKRFYYCPHGNTIVKVN